MDKYIHPYTNMLDIYWPIASRLHGPSNKGYYILVLYIMYTLSILFCLKHYITTVTDVGS